jgi:DNA-binding MarR family transcriptional regulator
MARPRTVSYEDILVAILGLNEQHFSFPSELLGQAVGASRPTINRRLKEMDAQDLIRLKPFRDEAGHRRYTVSVLSKGRKRIGKR